MIWLGNLIIKNLVARPRPCDIDTAVTLLLSRPHGHSFPSSRMYLFIHFPTDVLAGFAIAVLVAIGVDYAFRQAQIKLIKEK